MEEEEEYLAIYLYPGDLANLPKGWSRFANFKLSLINQANEQMTFVKVIFHVYLFLSPSPLIFILASSIFYFVLLFI